MKGRMKGKKSSEENPRIHQAETENLNLQK
jgi:hypothetical protein